MTKPKSDLTPQEAETDVDALWQFVQKLQAESKADPILDDRHPDDILYDEWGLPH